MNKEIKKNSMICQKAHITGVKICLISSFMHSTNANPLTSKLANSSSTISAVTKSSKELLSQDFKALKLILTFFGYMAVIIIFVCIGIYNYHCMKNRYVPLNSESDNSSFNDEITEANTIYNKRSGLNGINQINIENNLNIKQQPSTNFLNKRIDELYVLIIPDTQV
jgi:hypothetical protein